MNITEIEILCKKKEEELMNKYFGNLIHEAAVERPETIGKYTKDYPLKIEKEYAQYLKEIWDDVNPDKSKTFESIIDNREISRLITEDDREAIRYAYKDAKHRSLWELIMRTNHKDVTYYKGLLVEYTRELLNCLRCDFLEDVNKMTHD